MTLVETLFGMRSASSFLFSFEHGIGAFVGLFHLLILNFLILSDPIFLVLSPRFLVMLPLETEGIIIKINVNLIELPLTRHVRDNNPAEAHTQISPSQTH